jgi:succinate dehydrogenase / fumarate reductase cytochrome b subunit
MAQARKARPISPHLQIWRWGPAMLVSILHRVTGNGLAFAGLGLLLWWIGALANGPESYQSFLDYTWTGAGDGLQPVTAILGKVVLIGLTWAFFQHAASGIRHLILDIGAGCLPTRSSITPMTPSSSAPAARACAPRWAAPRPG